MPKFPIPCTNCLRFHYGGCYEAPKQCYECGGFNHIERYCPCKARVTVNRDEPLPGTHAWCNMWNLNDDPELKQKVLAAIKTSPSSAIWVNDECIYRGSERHFYAEEVRRGRGRPLEERITRARSRSPPRDRVPEWRQRRRSRSPLRRYSPSPYGPRSPSPNHPFTYRIPQRRRRSPSPLRRYSPLPYRRRRSPYDPRSPSPFTYNIRQRRRRSPSDECRREDWRQPAERIPAQHNMPANAKVPRYFSGPSLSRLRPAEDRAPLGDIRQGRDRRQSPSITRRAAGNENMPLSSNGRGRDPAPESAFIEDPEFVLGIRKGADEKE